MKSTVWPWREPRSPSAGHGVPSGRRVWAQCVVMAVAVGIFLFVVRNIIAASIVGFFLVLTLAGALFFPGLHRMLDRAIRALGRGIGLALSYVLLVPFYYLCFAPARLILKLRGKDPMQRAWEAKRGSYWDARPAVESETHYRRQF